MVAFKTSDLAVLPGGATADQIVLWIHYRLGCCGDGEDRLLVKCCSSVNSVRTLPLGYSPMTLSARRPPDRPHTCTIARNTLTAEEARLVALW